MSEKLSLGIEITADASKVLGGLRVTQKALLDTYAGAKGEVAALNEKLTQSRARAAELARGLTASGPPTKAMVAEFERARAAVNAAKDAVLTKTQALQKARLAARENAEAMAQVTRQAQAAAQAEALAASARASAASVAARNATIGGSMSALGLRGSTAIRQEIADVNRALASLRANGAAAQDIARATEQARIRVAALRSELAGAGQSAAGVQGSFAGAAHRMAAMAAAAISTQQAIQFLRESVNTGIKFDSLKTQFTFANGGDVRRGAEEMDFARRLSEQLGLELVGTSKAYAKLQAAAKGSALEGKATQDIFRAVASAGAVMGLSADEQAGALLAISQMMSKGTVMAEELKGQLGERLPGAFNIAAKAMGVTTAELQKMMEAGGVITADFLPKFAAALQESVNGSLPAAEASARAQLQRLENAFTEFKLRIANSGLLDKVAEQLERLLEHIGNMADSGELDQMAETFANTFGAVIQFMADATIMAGRFSDALGTLAQAIAAIVVGGRALALLGGSAAGVAAVGAAATGAAAGFSAAGAAAAAARVPVGLLAAAMRLIPGLAVGAALLYGIDKLVEWGAAAGEARTKAEALEGQLNTLIAENDKYASAAMRDAAGLREFGDEAYAAYQKAIEGARDYAAAQVVKLSQDNSDGRFDREIAFYRDQAAAYNEYLDTFIAGERLRRDHLRLTGRIVEMEASREKLATGEVKQTRKESLDAQIKDYEKLVDAIRKAREEAQKEVVDAKKRAEDFRSKGTDQKMAAQDKAAQIREGSLPEAQRQRNDRQRAMDAQSDGAYYAAAAAVAQLDGRGEQFQKYARDAEKFLERAMRFAEAAKDADLVEAIGKQQEGLQKTNAKAEDKRAADAEQQAANLMGQLNQVQGKLTEMKGEAATLQINAEIADAMNKLAQVETKIAALPDSKTITVNLVEVGGTSGAAKPAAIPARAYGGPLPGSAPHDRADNMLYWGTPGEWVIQRPAVRYWGSEFIASINAMRMPKFAFGGQLGGAAGRLKVPSILPSASVTTGAGESAVFDLGALGKVRARTSPSTSSDVAAVLKRAALQYGRD
jgi:tape measure domain-containing protein